MKILDALLRSRRSGPQGDEASLAKLLTESLAKEQKLREDWLILRQREAYEARIGADRMAIGLSSIPDKVKGDLDRVVEQRREIERLKERLALIGRTDPKGALVNLAEALKPSAMLEEADLVIAELRSEKEMFRSLCEECVSLIDRGMADDAAAKLRFFLEHYENREEGR